VHLVAPLRHVSAFFVQELTMMVQRLVTSDYSAEGGPEGGFTQRATIDPELDEWHLLSVRNTALASWPEYVRLTSIQGSHARP
jgi:hypothetical protein